MKQSTAPVSGRQYGSRFGFPLVSPDGEKMLFKSHRSGWINYWVVPLAGGEARQMAAQEADQDHASWSPDGEWIVYTSNHNGTHDLRVVSSEGGEARVLVGPELGMCAGPEWSPDGSQISYCFSSKNRPKDLYVLTVEGGEVRQLTNSMPAGNFEDRLVLPEKISYSSPDGFTIPAYLYRPKNVGGGEKYPGIIWIHGGPTNQYEDDFQHQPQSSQQSMNFFTQNGYVILQPNIRGSSGYGKAFEKANNRCWGKCDLQDVLAGVEYLKSLPYVNPDKIAITGRSYGANMTMAAVVHAPDVFQAAIAEGGYCAWENGILNDYPFKEVKLWEYDMGCLEGNEALYQELSPIHHVEKVTTPIFVIHGEGKGPIVPDSRLFVEKLRKYYKTYRYKIYPNEGYMVMGTENRRQMLVDKLAFYDQFLKDQVEKT